MTRQECTVCVVPAFGAERTLPRVVAAIRQAVPSAVIIVIDDGSRDGTSAAGAEADEVVRHETNRGKGAALRTGFDRALTRGADNIITLDADGQHDATRIPALLTALRDADIVVGARDHTGAMPVHRRFSNRASAAAIGHITGLTVRDAQSGFRAHRRAVVERVKPRGDHYEFETEMLILAARQGFRISSVPVPTIYGGTSHFRLLRDGARVVSTIWQNRRARSGAQDL